MKQEPEEHGSASFTFFTPRLNCYNSKSQLLSPEVAILSPCLPQGSIVSTRSRNCFDPKSQLFHLFYPKAQLLSPESSIVSTKAQSMESMVRSIDDDSLEVTSSNKHHEIIGTLSKRAEYNVGIDGWIFWELFTGKEGVLSTVVSRGSTVRFPEKATELFTVLCFLTPNDGSNKIRLTIAEGNAGEFFIGGFVSGHELAMEVVELKVVSGLPPSAFFKFMNNNKTPSSIKRHRKAQLLPPKVERALYGSMKINYTGIRKRARVEEDSPSVVEEDPRLEGLQQQEAAMEREHASRMQQLQLELEEAKKLHDGRQLADRPPTRVTAVPFTMAVPMTAEASAASVAAGAPAVMPVHQMPVHQMPVHPAAKDAELPLPKGLQSALLDAQSAWKNSQAMLITANGDPPPTP